MYTDPANFVDLTFLQTIVGEELNRINKLFQQDSANPGKLLSDLITFYCSLVEQVMVPQEFHTWSELMEFDLTDEYRLPHKAVDFGVQFRLALSEARGIDPEIVQDMKSWCMDYIVVLTREIKKRLLDNNKQLEALKSLSLSIVLCHV
jgi:hypothetical protein